MDCRSCSVFCRCGINPESQIGCPGWGIRVGAVRRTGTYGAQEVRCIDEMCGIDQTVLRCDERSAASLPRFKNEGGDADNPWVAWAKLVTVSAFGLAQSKQIV
jgi:hypothetical protein